MCGINLNTRVWIYVVTCLCSIPGGERAGIAGEFDQLDVSRQILQSDIIAYGDVRTVNVDSLERPDRRWLYEIVSPQFIAGKTDNLVPAMDLGGALLPGSSKCLLFLEPASYSMYSPTPIAGKPNLLFLQPSKDSKNWCRKFGLGKEVTIYELCDGWQSALLLDKSSDTLEFKIMRQHYNWTSTDAIIKELSPLVKFKPIQDKEGQAQSLLTELNAASQANDPFVEQNAAALLKRLGRKLEKKGDVYTLAPEPTKSSTHMSYDPAAVQNNKQ